MKRETKAITLGIIVIAIIIMRANTAIGDNQLAFALSHAKSVRVMHHIRPQIIRATPVVVTQNIEKTFGVNTKDIDKSQILLLQNFLVQNKYLDAKYVTGEFGPRTKQAVIDFQKANNLEPATGYVGDLTKAKVNSLLSAQ